MKYSIQIKLFEMQGKYSRRSWAIERVKPSFDFEIRGRMGQQEVTVDSAQRPCTLQQRNNPHDYIVKLKHFPRCWPFVRGIHRSPVNSMHRGQWRGALMFSLIRTWVNGWANNREASDLRRHRAHYDIIMGMPLVSTVHGHPIWILATYASLYWASAYKQHRDIIMTSGSLNLLIYMHTSTSKLTRSSDMVLGNICVKISIKVIIFLTWISVEV